MSQQTFLCLSPFSIIIQVCYVTMVCAIQGPLSKWHHHLSQQIHRCYLKSRCAITFDNLSYNNFLPSDSHHKSQLRFIRNIEVAILSGLSGHTNIISFLSSVLFYIFFCSSEDDFPLFFLFLKWTTVHKQFKFIINPDDL